MKFTKRLLWPFWLDDIPLPATTLDARIGRNSVAKRPWRDQRSIKLGRSSFGCDNNPAERSMRAIALGRKNYLFVGSEAGGKAAAIAYTLTETAKLNAVDPSAWLADTLARIPGYKITKIDDLLPWRRNG